MKLEVRNGAFAYKNGARLFSNVNFELHENQVLTILGQNGIGKTTLLKCMNGMLKWAEGGTYFNDRHIDAAGKLRELGYVPQAHPLSFSYSVRELVLMGRAKYIRPMAAPSKHDMEIADEAMEYVGITHLAERSCAQLSGGQLQLAFIARALAGEPQILILDEPESHLDFKNQLLILTLIEDMVANKNLSCIINTHFPEHALRISDKTLLLGGKDYLFGDTAEVITEENIEKYFGIRAKILQLGEEYNNKKAFVTLDFIRQ